MTEPTPQHPMAAAMQWVARIMASGLIVVLPGLAGQWIDERIGTRFLVLLGFGLGIPLSIAYLLSIAKTTNKES